MCWEIAKFSGPAISMVMTTIPQATKPGRQASLRTGKEGGVRASDKVVSDQMNATGYVNRTMRIESHWTFTWNTYAPVMIWNAFSAAWNTPSGRTQRLTAIPATKIMRSNRVNRR